jgi:predicted O-methyltransferase YrrM
MGRIRTALDQRLNDYLLANEPPEHSELERLRDLTAQMPDGHMQILPEQGHLLAFLVKLIDARRILELGTFAGYSAMAMALAQPEEGRVVTCDLSEDMLAIGRPCWQRAEVAARIDVMIAPALDSLAKLGAADMRFELVFIDADKMAYDRYYEAALTLVRPGGLVVLDNMLQRGEVADPGNKDPRTVAVRRLNTKIARDERVDRVLLPVADGMTLVRRRG